MKTFLFSPFRRNLFQKITKSTTCRWMSRRRRLSRTPSRSGQTRGNPECEQGGLGPRVTQGSLGLVLRFAFTRITGMLMHVETHRECVISVGSARNFGGEDRFVHVEWREEGSHALPEGALRDSTPHPPTPPPPVAAVLSSGHTCLHPEPQGYFQLAPQPPTGMQTTPFIHAGQEQENQDLRMFFRDFG